MKQKVSQAVLLSSVVDPSSTALRLVSMIRRNWMYFVDVTLFIESGFLNMGSIKPGHFVLIT